MPDCPKIYPVINGPFPGEPTNGREEGGRAQPEASQQCGQVLPLRASRVPPGYPPTTGTGLALPGGWGLGGALAPAPGPELPPTRTESSNAHVHLIYLLNWGKLPLKMHQEGIA